MGGIFFFFNGFVQASTINNSIINIPLTKKSKFVQYIIGYKLENLSNKKGYIYCWDGIQLSELIELKYLKCSGKDLIGSQVTGRGTYIMKMIKNVVKNISLDIHAIYLIFLQDLIYILLAENMV